jgi:hypothetical protein
VERIGSAALQVRLDGKDETRIAVDTKDYQDLDYDYASTIHKSQFSSQRSDPRKGSDGKLHDYERHYSARAGWH